MFVWVNEGRFDWLGGLPCSTWGNLVPGNMSFHLEQKIVRVQIFMFSGVKFLFPNAVFNETRNSLSSLPPSTHSPSFSSQLVTVVTTPHQKLRKKIKSKLWMYVWAADTFLKKVNKLSHALGDITYHAIPKSLDTGGDYNLGINVKNLNGEIRQVYVTVYQQTTLYKSIISKDAIIFSVK